MSTTLFVTITLPRMHWLQSFLNTILLSWEQWDFTDEKSQVIFEQLMIDLFTQVDSRLNMTKKCPSFPIYPRKRKMLSSLHQVIQTLGFRRRLRTSLLLFLNTTLPKEAWIQWTVMSKSIRADVRHTDGPCYCFSISLMLQTITHFFLPKRVALLATRKNFSECSPFNWRSHQLNGDFRDLLCVDIQRKQPTRLVSNMKPQDPTATIVIARYAPIIDFWRWSRNVKTVMSSVRFFNRPTCNHVCYISACSDFVVKFKWDSVFLLKQLEFWVAGLLNLAFNYN